MKKKKQRAFKLTGYFGKYKWLMLFGPLLKFLEAISDILTPFLVSRILDVGIGNGDTSYVIKYTILVVAINILGFIFAVVSQKCSSVTSKGIGRDIRANMFKHINTFSHAEFDKFSTASLTNRAVNDVEQIQNAVGQTLRNITRAPFLLIGSTVMALLLDVKLSLVFFAIMPLIVIVVFSIMKKTMPYYTEAKVNLDAVTNVSRENLSGIRVVRAFNKQNHEKQRFDKVNGALLKSDTKVGNISAVMQPLLNLVVNLAIVAIIWIGGIRVNVGGLRQGDIIAFISYFGQISMALVTISRLMIIYTRTGASIGRINEVFEVKNSLKEKQNPVQIGEDAKGEIEFKNVSFAYANGKNVVNNLSIKIKSGETIGIIGGTGSGKSSVVNLIPRFYDTSSGEVLVNGVSVKDYSLKQLRELVGIVPQNPMLFKGTIAENMRWRKEFATDQEIVKALKIAQAFDFVVEYPDFLQHKVERGGTNFSGGQKQRLTIARALVGNPKILILDDSSSALDFATDAALRKAIARSYKNITTIIVSQRTNSIKHCDKIIVMDNGNIAGIGKHEKLLKTCDVYKEIFYSQNKKEVENG